MISKEYPWLFAPRELLWGLISIPQYGYDWGYSRPYIELLTLDTTIIHYPTEKDKKRDKAAKIKEAQEIYKERLRLKEEGGKP